MIRLEVGGGQRPRGDGFVNLDRLPGPLVDYVCNVETEPLPFDDCTVDEFYSSHTLEHLWAPLALLWEVARVCRVGAPVEIRVPHEHSPMAMCPGHRCVLSEAQFRHWCEEFVEETWGDRPRRLKLLRVSRVGSASLMDAQALFPKLTADQIMRFVPGTCHEVRFFMEVVRNEGAP